MKITKIKNLVAATALAVSMTVGSVVPAYAADTSNHWEFTYGNPSYSIYIGESSSICRLFNDIRGNRDSITYKSSNTKIAAVNEDGDVIGKKAGTVTITATDGDHKTSCKLTVKPVSKIGKKEVVFNYEGGTTLEYKKTYTLKTLAGSQVKKLTNVKGAKISGKKFTITKKTGCTIKATLDNNKEYKVKYYTKYTSFDSATRTKAKNIIKKDMKKYGITMDSSDLEKVAFAWNWIGDNITNSGISGAGSFRDHKKCDYCYSIGKDCGIINGVGDCDVYAEAFATICETVGIWTVYVWNNKGGADHLYNGVRVDGEWYLIDASWCDPWDFDAMLMSENYLISSNSVYKFKAAKNACKDIQFTSTKYDGLENMRTDGTFGWSKYFEDYEENNKLWSDFDEVYNYVLPDNDGGITVNGKGFYYDDFNKLFGWNENNRPTYSEFLEAIEVLKNTESSDDIIDDEVWF